MASKMLDKIAMGLVAVGGINWGLVGAFNINLVANVFSGMLLNVVYIAVGVSAVYLVYKAFK